jgi:hypothetical protein
MSWTTPAVVGRYLDAGKAQFYPVSEAEIRRAARAYLRVLDSYSIAPRSQVLIVSLASQVAYFMPLERALEERNWVISYADASVFDAARVEMFARRFNVAAVFGVSQETLKGFDALGHVPEHVFAGRIVWATPGAYARLSPGNGYTLRQWAELGPAVGVECAIGDGLHVSSEDWCLETTEGGELLVSSRLPRLVPFERWPSGLHGELDRTPCRCGSTDGRVRLRPRVETAR